MIKEACLTPFDKYNTSTNASAGIEPTTPVPVPLQKRIFVSLKTFVKRNDNETFDYNNKKYVILIT